MARPLWYAAAVAIVYAVASLPGQALLIQTLFVSPIRLSAGVAIAALTFAPTRHWWLVILALIPLHAAVGDPSTMYLVARQYFAANTAEALIVAGALRWLLGDRIRLDNLKSALIFLVSAVVVGPLIGATLGVPAITDRDLTIDAFSTWEIWAFADAVGNLAIIPVLLAVRELATRWRARFTFRLDFVRIAEAAVVWGGILLLTTAPGLGQAALGRRTTFSLSMLYAPFPLLIWASIRFGPGGAAAANAMMTAVTVLYALTSRAPFGQPWNVNSVLETQQFLIVAAGTTITLAALVAERWRAQEAEREGQERMRLAMNSAGIGTWLWEFETDRFLVSDELAALLGLDEPIVGALAQNVDALTLIIHPDDREFVQADLAIFRGGDVRERSRRFRAVRADGTVEWLKVGRAGEDGEVTGELRIVRADGSMAWIESHSRVLRDANGVPNRVLGLAIDISQRKELQAERESTTQALMRLARSTLGDRGEIDEALREIAVTAADTLAVDRCGVWLFNEPHTQLRCVCDYERSSGLFSSGIELSVDSYPIYFQTIREERTVAVEDTSSDPRTIELAAAHRTRGVSSMLDAPVYLRGRLVGAVSFLHVGAPRDWSIEAQNFAGSMADLLSRAFESVERRKAEAQLQRAYEQLRNLTRRLEAAKEDERRDIARELHDELGQSITAIVIGLHLVTLDDREGRHAKRLKQTVALAERLIERVRAMSLNLRPPLLDELGLITALRGLVEGQAQQAGLAITFDSDGIEQRLAPELEIGAFRIIQECLTNVARHAAAGKVDVRLAAADGQLSIEVVDDGRGFDVGAAFEASARGRHLGLLGMQERVTVLGGRFDMRSSPGNGTRIAAHLPLQLAES